MYGFDVFCGHPHGKIILLSIYQTICRRIGPGESAKYASGCSAEWDGIAGSYKIGPESGDTEGYVPDIPMDLKHNPRILNCNVR